MAFFTTIKVGDETLVNGSPDDLVGHPTVTALSDGRPSSTANGSASRVSTKKSARPRPPAAFPSGRASVSAACEAAADVNHLRP